MNKGGKLSSRNNLPFGRSTKVIKNINSQTMLSVSCLVVQEMMHQHVLIFGPNLRVNVVHVSQFKRESVNVIFDSATSCGD